MRSRIVVAAILTGFAALAAAPATYADDSAVTTTVSSPTGTRTMTVPLTLAVAVDPGSASTTVMSVSVEEILAAGADWTVTTDLCGTTDSGLTADCTRVQLDRDDLASSIGGSLNASDETDGVIGTAEDSLNGILSPCPTRTSGEGTMDVQRTIMSCGGTDPGTAYSAIYTWDGTYGVDLSSFFESGTYKGFVRFTLTQ